MYPKEKIEETLKYIEIAEKFISNTIDRNSYLKEFETITCVQDIGKSTLLSFWKSSIIYNLEGLTYLKNEGKKIKNTKTYLLIHPLFIDLYPLIKEELYNFIICRKNIFMKEYYYYFTKELVVRLYGGTPWFEPYARICMKKNAFFKKSVCYQIVSQNNEDCVLDLVDFKNRFKKNYPELELKMIFKDCELPGKINPFHTPDSIENDNHVEAIEKVLVKKYYE